MTQAPRILALGGIDPCGGAGLTADTRMIQARGCMALAVPACLTVQNRHGLLAIEPVGDELLEGMVRAALEDGPVHAVKTGLLGQPSVVARIAELLQPLTDQSVPLVVDPVFSATAGGFDAGAELVRSYLDTLVPRATVLTPNLPEMELLAPDSDAAALLARGCDAVLVKGGHAADDVVEDRLWTAGEETVFRHPRIACGPVHGTGCALASAVACALARGHAVDASCRDAVTVLGECLAATPPSEDGRAVPLVVR